MKLKHLLIPIVLIFINTIYSCSDDNESVSENNNENPTEGNEDGNGDETIKYINEIDYTNNQNNDKLLYENDKLHQIFIYCCQVTNSNGSFKQGNLYQFEYNNDKISSVYVKSLQYNGDYPNLNNQEINNSQNKQFTYVYDNQNRLIELAPENNQYRKLEFLYDSNRISQIKRYSLQDGDYIWTTKTEIFYDSEENVSQTALTYLSSGFTYNQYFTYDDKKNPFNVLNESFGLIDFSFSFYGFDTSNGNLQYYLSKNNVIETANNDGPQNSVDYEYENNYPVELLFNSDGINNSQYLIYQ
ncbi:hypothetical protein [Mesonia maritima]|uniref:YD repeat-containing protein n=1 Tax=Mesonia maritima TaxID=1793873 RepID=A0ABU1K9K5_9FLAO|nr:hypothetical protein [Mesonia maritima]MDR6302285.1 hypothetical protein [Mesonia maritima]